MTFDKVQTFFCWGGAGRANVLFHLKHEDVIFSQELQKTILMSQQGSRSECFGTRHSAHIPGEVWSVVIAVPWVELAYPSRFP